MAFGEPALPAIVGQSESLCRDRSFAAVVQDACAWLEACPPTLLAQPPLKIHLFDEEHVSRVETGNGIPCLSSDEQRCPGRPLDRVGPRPARFVMGVIRESWPDQGDPGKQKSLGEKASEGRKPVGRRLNPPIGFEQAWRDDAEARIGQEGGHELLDAVRFRDRVHVECEYVRVGAACRAYVDRCAIADVLGQLDNLYFRPLLAYRIHCRVGGGVVDYHYVQLRVRLCGERAYARLQPAPAVMDGDYRHHVRARRVVRIHGLVGAVVSAARSEKRTLSRRGSDP